MEPGNKVEVPQRRDRRKKLPGVSALIGGENRRWRSNSPRLAYKIARCVAGFSHVACSTNDNHDEGDRGETVFNLYK